MPHGNDFLIYLLKKIPQICQKAITSTKALYTEVINSEINSILQNYIRELIHLQLIVNFWDSNRFSKER